MARLSCGVQCSRTLLFILNTIFLLIGLSVLSFGIYIQANGNFSSIPAIYNITQAIGMHTVKWGGTVMIIAGAFTSCLAAFGFLGAICKNRGFLYSYAVILILVILLEFAAVIVVLKFRDQLWKTYDSGFGDVFQNAYRNNNTEMIKLIEEMEQDLKCCGVDGALDYIRHGIQIPKSCYPNKIPRELYYPQGCAVAVANWIWNQLPIIASVLGAILFVEVFGVISSLVLGVAISHSSDDEVYQKYQYACQ